MSVCPLTKHGQEQSKEKSFHDHFLVEVEGFTGGTPEGWFVFTTGVPVDVAGLLAGAVAGAFVGDLAAGVDDLAAGVVRGVGFF